MRKARVKRYQHGGTAGAADDAAEDENDQNKGLIAGATPPPLLARSTAGTRANPSTTAPPAIRARQPILPASNPATALKNTQPSGPFGSAAAPAGSVGSNQAVVKNPVIDPMANARALDAGAKRDATTGFGTGATSVANTKAYMDANAAPSAPGTRGFNLPSGGFAAVGPAKNPPIAPTQPSGQTMLAGLPRKPTPTGFVYGGRVDMTPPGNIGFKRPGPFRSGGRVPAFRHGGRVKKMQSGGRSDLNDMLNSSPETAFLGKPSPTPKPTPKPRKMQDGGSVEEPRSFMDKVKGVASSLASRVPDPANSEKLRPFADTARGAGILAKNDNTFHKGGKVKKMQSGGMAAESDSTLSLADRPVPPTPNIEPKFLQDGGIVGMGGVPGSAGDMSRSARETQAPIPVPPKHQFRMGGRICQRGGKIPGQPTGKDTVPAMLSPGEVVLNPKQQKRVVVRPNWQQGLNPKEKSAMSSMRLPRARNQRAVTGNTVPRIFGGK
jgi:hypothetical protein